MSSTRTHIRLFEEDVRCLQELSKVTVCATRSAAIKMSLQVLDTLWAEKRSGNRIVLRNEALQREHEVFVGSYARPNKLAPDTEGNFEGNFEVRLSGLDLARLDSLLRSDAGLNRSHVIREAIVIYAHIARRLAEHWNSFIVLPGGERTPFRVPGLKQQATDPVAAPEVKPVEARVLRLLPGVGQSRLPDAPESWTWSVPSDLQIQVEELAEKTHLDRNQTLENLVREALRALSSKPDAEPVRMDAVSTRGGPDVPVAIVLRPIGANDLLTPPFLHVAPRMLGLPNVLNINRCHQRFRELLHKEFKCWQSSQFANEAALLWEGALAGHLVAASSAMVLIETTRHFSESLRGETPHIDHLHHLTDLTPWQFHAWPQKTTNTARCHEARDPEQLCVLCPAENPLHVHHDVGHLTSNTISTTGWECVPLESEALSLSAWKALAIPPGTDKRR